MAYDGEIIIDVDVLTQKAEEHLEQLKQVGVDSSDDISERMKYNARKIAYEWEEAGNKFAQVMEDMKSVASEIDNIEVNIETEMAKPVGERDLEGLAFMKADLEQAKTEYAKLNQESEKLTRSMDWNAVKAEELLNGVKKSDESLKSATRSSRDLGSSLSGSFKSITKYALALFSFRSIYQTLRSLSNQWMNSDDLAAQQMKANLEGIKGILANAIAPLVQFIGNIITSIVGYISAFLKVFFGINLAAKQAGKTINKGVGSGLSGAREDAEEIKNILAGFDKAEVVSIETPATPSGGGGGGGVGGAGFDVAPTLDTSPFEKAMKKLKADLKPFIDTINSIDFTPMQENFAKVVDSMKGLLNVLYESFIRTMNNAVGPFIKILSEDIIPRALFSISEAIDMITPHLEWLLMDFIEPFIEWFLLDYYPAWLDVLIAAFDLVMAALDPFLEGVRQGLEILRPFVEILGTLLVWALEVVAEGFERLTEIINEEDSALAELIKTIGIIVTVYLGFKTILGVVGGVIKTFTGLLGILKGAFGFVLGIVKTVAAFFAGGFTASIGGIIAIIGILVTAIVGIATNFELVKKDIWDIVESIKGIISGLGNFIAGVFTGDWSRAWSGVVSVFRNIVSGIANIFKFPINVMISGINAFIRGINRIKIPSWVPAVGGKGFNISPIPHLAKGGVLTQPTLNVAGEYAGAKRNPEIVTPENKMREAMADVLQQHGGIGNDDDITIVTQLVVDSRTLAETEEKVKRKDYMQNNGRLRTAWT